MFFHKNKDSYRLFKERVQSELDKGYDLFKERVQSELNYVDSIARVGDRIKYLGLDMLVLRNTTPVYNDFYGEWYKVPKLLCEYVDNNGVVRQKEFMYCDLDVIACENGRSGENTNNG